VYLRVFINLTPFIPLSFKGEGEEIYMEGFHPSLTYTPPSLAKGRGQGDRLLNNLCTCSSLRKPTVSSFPSRSLPIHLSVSIKHNITFRLAVDLCAGGSVPAVVVSDRNTAQLVLKEAQKQGYDTKACFVQSSSSCRWQIENKRHRRDVLPPGAKAV